MTKIVGFLGNKGSGKDTCGSYLVEKYGYVRYAFGDPVKEVCKNLFNLSEEQLNGEKKEVVDVRWNMKPREMYQLIGTEFGQFEIHKIMPKINEKVKLRNLWCYLFEMWLEEHKNENIVITDVRFKHEINCILKHGGEIIKIENPNIEKNDSHISELELNDIYINKTILNNSELVDLYSQLDIIALVPF